MEKNEQCSVVRDLLPNYVEKLTNEPTNHFIEEHLSNCEECSAEYAAMMSHLEAEKVPDSQQREAVKYLKKTKYRYLVKGILLSIGIIALVVTLIIDLAVNHHLTWSLLVGVSVLYAYIVGFTAVFSSSGKLIKALAAATVLLLPYLFTLEKIINLAILDTPYDWFISLALPIGCIWIVICWIPVIMMRLLKLNYWSTYGILLLLGAVGSVLTNAIAKGQSLSYAFWDDFQWITTICVFIAGIICFVIGYFIKGNRKH